MSAFERLLSPQIEQARERRIGWIVPAKVVSIDDDGLYRLDYLSMGDGAPSAPARVMAPMAGAKRGVHFLPEPGDEVVVAFEDGDPGLPVILGAVWNRESPVPSQADATPTNNTRTIVSRSGHELTFDDTPSQEKVTLKSKSGHIVELDDRPGLGKVTIKSANGQSVELDDRPPGKLTLQSATGAKVTLDNAAGTASIEALASITLSALQIRMQAPAGITLQTTGAPQASLVTIDNSLYGVHTHFLAPPATTGPLAT